MSPTPSDPLRTAALKVKDQYYFGNPCKRGHGKDVGATLRRTDNGACVECQRERQRSQTAAYSSHPHAK